MPTKSLKRSYISQHQRGVTLVELIAFIVVISVALGGLLGVYQYTVINSADPVKRIRMLQYAQARLDAVMALRYDEATPAGGVPACDSGEPGAQACTNTPDGDMDDVDDYHNEPGTPAPGYSSLVTREVTTLEGEDAKLVTVTVTANDGESLTLSAYRVNF